ncbi:MAG: polysaccharide deacetylase [Clostridiales bacterium]|nr:polysaccharide deacetylase [Clostridiales bacterium]
MKKRAGKTLITVLLAVFLMGGYYRPTKQESSIVQSSTKDTAAQTEAGDKEASSGEAALEEKTEETAETSADVVSKTEAADGEGEDADSSVTDSSAEEDSSVAEEEENQEEDSSVIAEEEDQETNTSVTAEGEEQEDSTADDETEDEEATPEEADEEALTEEEQEVMEQAALLAAQYDYSGALHLLRTLDRYKTNDAIHSVAVEYKRLRDSCVEYNLEEITHVFFHSLIVDTSKAFDGDSDADGYNQMMTTMSEFQKIIQILYDKGYVLVSPYDMATVNEDGTVTRGTISLPEGKIPFVLSQDDLSYYHYMDGDGFASRLVLDENGDVKCEYVEDDGTVSVGDYDVVPILNTFIDEHPDFSYHGFRGIVALTGYNGVFGYRTDVAYQTRENLTDDQIAYLDAHPDFNYEEEVAQATEIANVLKAQGWLFASHTWGHRNATESTAEELQTDNEKWTAYVAPIVGETDMIVFAFGADIGDWNDYTSDNSKYAYYKSVGYNYFFNVDSSQYFVQITSEYFRQGRRNLDGYRMYYNPDLVSDLFEVSEVWDMTRPVVPEM